MLELYDLKDGSITHLEVALQRFTRQIDVLRQQKADIEQAIEELSRTVGVISGMLRDRQTPVEIPLEAAE
jgi:prefoldin subunit 5